MKRGCFVDRKTLEAQEFGASGKHFVKLSGQMINALISRDCWRVVVKRLFSCCFLIISVDNEIAFRCR